MGDGVIVQKEDVDLLDQSFQFSFGAAAVGLGVLAGAPLLAATTILGIVQAGYVVFRTLHLLRRKAVKVTSAQYAVVGALKAIDDPATPAEIREVLGARGDNIDIEAVLEELRTLRSPDGKSAGFVEQERDGRWMVVGI